VSPVKSVGVVVLSLVVVVWSEVYFPVKESVGLDLFRLTSQLYQTRAGTQRMRLEMPKLGPEIEALKVSVQGLAEQFATAFSNELYIVVNPNGNRLSLRRGQKVLFEAAISTGRNDTLTYQSRKWVFQTPRGIMSVIRKKKDPVWIKPDWAFLIHGTPQENLLGRSVTHGCIRVGYDDLKVLFDSVPVGTRVFIF
jgi:lipoprotein-anchoring transpeptidase ErfK/SrfK